LMSPRIDCRIRPFSDVIRRRLPWIVHFSMPPIRAKLQPHNDQADQVAASQLST
jgi:hypothetical protein